MEFIQTRQDQFGPFVEDDEPFEKYCSRMKKVRLHRQLEDSSPQLARVCLALSALHDQCQLVSVLQDYACSVHLCCALVYCWLSDVHSLH